MKKISIWFLLVLSALILNSCKDKVTEVDYNPNVLSSKDFVRAEDVVMEMFNAFFKGINDSLIDNHGYGYIDNCSVTYYPADNSMTFGYGDVLRECSDGKYRKGLFRGVYTGEIFVEGVTVNLNTVDLYVGNTPEEVFPVQAEIEITNLGLNEHNLPEYTFRVKSTQIITDTLKSPVNISTDYIMEWTEGSDTPEIHEDDIFSLTGTATGTSSDGYEFSIQIQDTLISDIDCYWISLGKSVITVPDGVYKTGDIDYIFNDGCYNRRDYYFNDNLFFDYIK